VRLENCYNVSINGFTIDYNPPPFIYGQITSIPEPRIRSNSGAVQVAVTLGSKSMTPDDYINSYPTHDTWPPIIVFDGKTRTIRCTPCGWGSPPAGTKVSDGVYRFNVCPDNVQVGDIMIGSARYGFTYSLSNSSLIVSQDINIQAAGYFSVVEANGEGGNTYRRIRVVSPYNDRPLPSNADGFHSANAKKGPLIENCEIQNMNDDFFNVHNTLQLVAQRVSDTTLLLIDPHLFGGPANSIYGTFETLSHTLPGDRFSFYNLNALSSSDLLATATVQSIALADNSSLISQTYSAANSVAQGCPLNACSGGMHPWSSATLYSVSFTTPLPSSIKQTTLVSSDTYSGMGSIIRNNNFNGTSCSLGRTKSPNGGMITNNTLSFACAQNLEVGPLQYWIEGPLGITGTSVTSNTLVSSGSSPIHTYASQVTIQDNKVVP